MKWIIMNQRHWIVTGFSISGAECLDFWKEIDEKSKRSVCAADFRSSFLFGVALIDGSIRSGVLLLFHFLIFFSVAEYDWCLHCPGLWKKNDVEKVIKDFYRLIEWIGRMTIVMELLYIAPTKKYDLVVKYVFAKQYNKQVC